MHIQNIKIHNYKNLSDIELDISPKINCLIGENGTGKTNFLDTIYFLSNSRSYFNHIDAKNILYGEEYFFIEGKFKNEDNYNTVLANFSVEKNKTIKLNSKKYSKLSEHYGKFPVVIITPYDVNLILDGSELRRNFMDTIIAQYNKEFLINLINYKKILIQRNALLKKFAENRIFDQEMLAIFDYKLIKLNPQIFNCRKNFIDDFMPIFYKYYNQIARANENIQISYKSQLCENDIEKLLSATIKKDLVLQRTTTGIHKDDLFFTIDDNPLKKNASQGQQKSFLTALKFAQSDFIKKHTNIRPILLLDDIFDKLDSNRVKNVVELVANNHFGQIFITHTDAEKLKEILTPVGVDYSIYQFDNGKIEKCSSN
ncbi:MAG: DNA replication/repair protein RecF [Bacteroidales bacterium]|nr:DNA replication/repair protein RecF [Bacteroidales bacterium]